MAVCPLPPDDKQAYLELIGHELAEVHGKQKFYPPEEVERAHKRYRSKVTNGKSGSSWTETVTACWAMSVFSSHEEFDRYHLEQGEACDYTEMKRDMLASVLVDPVAEAGWWSLPDWQLDGSWLDLGDLCDGLFEGLTGLVEGIFDDW